MTSDRARARRRVARVVLGIGALLEIGLISSLPVAHMTTAEMQSFVSLAALFVVSAGCAVSLRRWGRESVATLTVGAIYAIYLMARLGVAIRQQLFSAAPSFGPTRTWSVILAAATLVKLPIALVVAWPLRTGETDRRA